jgi:uncharacterized protein YbjT (DUF2867 family)
MAKRILVLGATGPTGLAVVREALQRGHVVVAYVRNPSKIPAELTANKNLEVCSPSYTDQTLLTLEFT